MKKLLAILLCAIAAAGAAEAKTYYVDAARPNNNGNGLKPKTAKKTIQAAINIAKNGDTILVYPGTYPAIGTNNKKIKIKAKSGAASTTIVGKQGTPIKKSGPYHLYKGGAIAKLGKEITKSCRLMITIGEYKTVTVKSGAITKGNATSLTGFTLNGNNLDCNDESWRGGVLVKGYPRTADLAYIFAAVSGGTVVSCVLENCGNAPLAVNSKFAACEIVDNKERPEMARDPGRGVENSTFNRCFFVGNVFQKCSLPNTAYANASYVGGLNHSKFYNCLFAANSKLPFSSCTLVNCTVADNRGVALGKTKATNTIFHKVPAAQFKKAKKNTLTACYTGGSPQFDRESGDYKLAQGSPCINKGKLTAALKKIVGTKDLGGGKRIKDKRIDIGCHEF